MGARRPRWPVRQSRRDRGLARLDNRRRIQRSPAHAGVGGVLEQLHLPQARRHTDRHPGAVSTENCRAQQRQDLACRPRPMRRGLRIAIGGMPSGPRAVVFTGTPASLTALCLLACCTQEGPETSHHNDRTFIQMRLAYLDSTPTSYPHSSFGLECPFRGLRFDRSASVLSFKHACWRQRTVIQDRL